MEITNAKTAREWLAAWANKPRPGILKEVIRGLKMGLSIMRSAPRRYTQVEVANTKEAMAELEKNLARQKLMKARRSLLKLERNNEQAALEFAAAAIDAGEFAPEAAEILLMLQDNPTSLQEKLQKLMEGER